MSRYFDIYRKRAPLDYVMHEFEHEGVQKLRTLLKPGSPLFRGATRVYSFFKANRGL